VIYRNRCGLRGHVCGLLARFSQVKLRSVMIGLCVTRLPLENVKWCYVIDFERRHL